MPRHHKHEFILYERKTKTYTIADNCYCGKKRNVEFVWQRGLWRRKDAH